MLRQLSNIPFFFCFVLSLWGCDQASVNPASSSAFSRNSSWKVVTLSTRWANNIWGISPKDIYLVGDEPDYISHYDGNIWTPQNFHISQGGTIQGIVSVWGIFGFSREDIWVVGARYHYNPTPTKNYDISSLLVHFNGSTWDEVPIAGQGLYSVWGTSSNRMWAGGDSGQVFYFDGSSWASEAVDFFPTAGDTRYYSSFAGTATSEPMATIYGFCPTNGYEPKYLMQRESGHWVLLDSLTSTANQIYSLWMSPTGQLFGAGLYLSHWTGTAWTAQRGSPQQPVLCTFGSSDDNRFAAGYGGLLSHFNGVDWVDLPLISGDLSFFYRGWTDGSRVFLLGITENSQQVLVHN